MHTIDEAFDHTKLNEAADINIIKDWKTLIDMQLQPLLDRPARTKGGKQSTEVEIWKTRAVNVNVVRALVLHAFSICEEVVDFRRWGVDVSEEEEIEH